MYTACGRFRAKRLGIMSPALLELPQSIKRHREKALRDNHAGEESADCPRRAWKERLRNPQLLSKPWESPRNLSFPEVVFQFLTTYRSMFLRGAGLRSSGLRDVERRRSSRFWLGSWYQTLGKSSTLLRE